MTGVLGRLVIISRAESSCTTHIPNLHTTCQIQSTLNVTENPQLTWKHPLKVHIDLIANQTGFGLYLPPTFSLPTDKTQRITPGPLLRSSVVRIHHRSNSTDKSIEVGTKRLISVLVRKEQPSNGIVLIAQDRIDIALQRRRRLRIAIDEQRRLLRLHTVLVQSPDIRGSVNRIAVLKHVDVVGDAPVDVVHPSAGVEEHRVAASERVLGKGGGILHVLLAAGVLTGRFVDEEAVEVDVLGCACGRVPVLVVADVCLELALGDGAGADVGSARTAVITVRRLRQSCYLREVMCWEEQHT